MRVIPLILISLIICLSLGSEYFFAVDILYIWKTVLYYFQFHYHLQIHNIKVYIERNYIFYRPYTCAQVVSNYIAFYSLFQEAALTSERNRCKLPPLLLSYIAFCNYAWPMFATDGIGSDPCPSSSFRKLRASKRRINVRIQQTLYTACA